jgi:rod shape-determining protein MreD
MSVVLGSLFSLLPIVSATGWWPNAGLLMLLAWRLLRADAWPAWWAAPLGFANDLITGSPIGLSISLWSAIMIAMDILDRRTMWRDYWIEWAIAALFIGLAELAQWRVAAILGASVPLNMSTGPAIIISVLCFPVAAFLAARLDRWRLGR